VFDRPYELRLNCGAQFCGSHRELYPRRGAPPASGCSTALWVLLWFCCDSRSIFGVRVTTPMPRTSR